MKVQVYVDGALLIDTEEVAITKLHDGWTDLAIQHTIEDQSGYKFRNTKLIVQVPKRLLDTCDYAHLKGPYLSGRIHGPAVHAKGGYLICDNCYQAMMAAERQWDEAQRR